MEHWEQVQSKTAPPKFTNSITLITRSFTSYLLGISILWLQSLDAIAQISLETNVKDSRFVMEVVIYMDGDLIFMGRWMDTLLRNLYISLSLSLISWAKHKLHLWLLAGQDLWSLMQITKYLNGALQEVIENSLRNYMTFQNQQFRWSWVQNLICFYHLQEMFGYQELFLRKELQSSIRLEV